LAGRLQIPHALPLSMAAIPPYMRAIMARPTPQAFDKKKIVAENRRARFEYFVEDVYEAGIALTGTEVKNGEVWLVNSNVPEFSHGNRYNHEPKRLRKLLLKEREIAKFHGAVERKGMTLVPLSIYFNGRGRAKVELALAKGKNAADKRATVKDRDWQRDKARIMREHG